MAFEDTQAVALEAISAAQAQFGREAVADALGASARQVDRWMKSSRVPLPGAVATAVREMLRRASQRSGDVGSGSFTFIDLFAGIGGTRLGWEAAGGRCVFTCEYDKYCQKTYRDNFLPEHEIAGDITTITDPATQIPDHDVLVGGFPCQPFSISGVSKRNALGRAHGFACDTQGTLFFNIAQILAAKRPAAFMLENVKNLQSHDKGRTFDIIRRTLEDELGYRSVEARVIDARPWVPQHRERIFIVGFRESVAFSLKDLIIPATNPGIAGILHGGIDGEIAEPRFAERTRSGKLRALDKYTLTDHLWSYLQAYKEKHEAAGNGFGFGLVDPRRTGAGTRTLSARYYKDGSEILIRQKSGNPRRLTPRECARLMGFPSDFKITVSDTQAYKQFGNSVVVPVIATVARAMQPHVVSLKRRAEESEQTAMVV